MFYEALHIIEMHEEPSQGSPVKSKMLQGDVGREINSIGDVEKWHELVVLANFFPPRQGWVKAKGTIGDLIKTVEAPPRPDFDLLSFLKACVDCQNWINRHADPSGFFVLADYLVAWASIASKIKNIGPKSPITDSTGPFQIASEDWARFLASPLGANFVAEDRENGLNQISGAGFLALEAMSAISEGVLKHDADTGDQETSGPTGPYIPSYVDVLLANLFGIAAAVDLRLAKLDEQGGRSVDTVLAAHFSADELAQLLSFRPGLLRNAAGTPETVDGLLLNTESLLNSELEKAFKLISDNIPEDLPKVDGAAPWMAVAEAELAKWETLLINERSAPGEKRVLDYFDAIRFQTAVVEPWCGAFVGFCLLQLGEPFSAAVVDGPARAANWKSWGNVSIPLGQPSVPVGAVVVLAPEKGSARSGHVGFFSRYFGDNESLVEILGGNQSDTVTRTKFARSKITAIRWFSPVTMRETAEAETALAARPGDGNTGFERLLDLIGELESNNNYNAFFSNSANIDRPAFTLMTISQVLAWQKDFVNVRRSPSSAVGKFQFLQKTLGGLRDDGVVENNDLFNQASQDKLAIALMTGRGLGRFLSGAVSAEDFGLSLAKEWASLPVPRNVVRGSRTVLAGQSYYAGDGLNRALVSVPAFLDAINSIRP